MSVRFIALSGTTVVTENVYLYESGKEIIVVDCGVGFPDSDMTGVDLVIPDFSYLKENAKRVKAILISHGHEDHIGATPFLPSEIKAPIYATSLVAGFIEDKLADYRVRNRKITVFDPETDVLSLGEFQVTPFRVCHSVPDSVGFAIDSPEGRFLHVSDYKFDWSPVDARPFDVAKLASLAASGVLALASDALGSTTPGYTESEQLIERRIEEIVKIAPKKVFFTTISSNISRMQQALHVAKRLGRKVCFIGRSIERKAKIAKYLGYLHYSRELVVSPAQATKLASHKVMYLISGSYGQPGSALYRVAVGEHQFLSIEKNDVVVFSSDPAPPGSKQNVDFVVDRLIEVGADVHYYDLQEDLHVSGHGSQEDIKMLFALARPKYFIPIGSTIRHMRAYSQLACSMGAEPDQVFELLPGDMVDFKDKQALYVGNIPVKEVLVDGTEVGDVGKVVLRDRKILAKDGIAIVLIQLDRNKNKLLTTPEIISRGFVFEKAKKDLLKRASKALRKQIEKRRLFKKYAIRQLTISFLKELFVAKTGRRPMILPVIVEV